MGCATSAEAHAPVGRRRACSVLAEEVKEQYEDFQKIGQGTFGTVCRSTHRATGEVRAIKRISKAGVENPLALRKEIDVHSLLDHANVVKLHESFEDHREIHLVLEYCTGGELFDRIVYSEHGHLSEADSAAIFQDVLRAIDHLHSLDVVHRDIKAENYMMASMDLRSPAKLIDFGTACLCKERQTLYDMVGTVSYMAPEVAMKRYGRSCDLWSAGALLYAMLSGSPAIRGKTVAEQIRNVRSGKYAFDHPVWGTISKEAISLISRLMNKIPRARYTAKQALAVPWVAKGGERSESARGLPRLPLKSPDAEASPPVGSVASDASTSAESEYMASAWSVSPR